MDLIDRQALLKQIDIDSDGEPGYYGDTWRFIDTIKSMPSATDKNVGTKLSTNLAEVGTDMIFRWQAIDALCHVDEYNGRSIEAIRQLPPAKLGTNLAEVGTDCISRQQAIDALDEIEAEVADGYGYQYAKWREYFAEMPSAQPEQRYTEEELRVFKHGISLSLLSKRSAQHWRYDKDTATEIKFLERLYEKVSADMRGAE